MIVRTVGWATIIVGGVVVAAVAAARAGLLPVD